MGKTAEVINCSVAPQDLRWLYHKGEFRVYNGSSEEQALSDADLLIATDLGGSGRLGNMLPPILRSRCKKAVLDHHIYENDIFDLPVIDPKASSTAEIVYRILIRLRAELDEELAIPLYVGLTSDTGNFRYSSTTRAVHEMAGHLLSSGVRPEEIWHQMECQVPFDKMKCLGLLLARILIEEDGRLAWVSADRKFLERNQTVPRDSFEVVNYFLRLKGVEIGAFLLEIGAHLTKVSLRSSGVVDVSLLALEHGGGGHRFAAGFTLPHSLREAEGIVLQTIKQRLREAPTGAV
jgi:phosphoesterase RecJ-like protein